MGLTKFIIPPEATGYSMEDPDEVVAIKLDGGASRYRRDKLGGTSKVSVKWSFDRDEYHYFRAFYRSLLGRGAQPFLIDLVIDLPDPIEHKAYFVPGTVRLQEQRGHYYGVTAELEAYPTAINETEEANLATLFSWFGATYSADFPPLEDQLDTLINTNLPGYL